MTVQAVPTQTPETHITSLLVTTGHKVDQAVDQAIIALIGSNTHIVTGLMENAVAIQEMEATIDRAIFSALEHSQLSPAEIHKITTIANINRDLARLGKLAANLGRKVRQVGEHREQEDFSRLQPLAIAVSHLCRQTLKSLTRLDPVLAHNAAKSTSSVDAYRDYVVRSLRHGDGASEEQDMHLVFASRCLEQLADHAVDLAENLVRFLESEPSPANKEPVAC